MALTLMTNISVHTNPIQANPDPTQPDLDAQQHKKELPPLAGTRHGRVVYAGSSASRVLASGATVQPVVVSRLLLHGSVHGFLVATDRRLHADAPQRVHHVGHCQANHLRQRRARAYQSLPGQSPVTTQARTTHPEAPPPPHANRQPPITNPPTNMEPAPHTPLPCQQY